jgi:DNA-binding MarR family transcriptional regulator
MSAVSRKRWEAGQIINSIRLIKGVNRRYSKELMKDYQITGQQLAALRIVLHAPDISLGDLSQKMYVHISTSCGIVDRLERKGYLTRVRDKRDRRVVQLRITRDGKRVVSRTPEVGYSMLLQDIDKLPNSEVHRIWETMRLLMKVMRIEGDFRRMRPSDGSRRASDSEFIIRRKRPGYGG